MNNAIQIVFRFSHVARAKSKLTAMGICCGLFLFGGCNQLAIKRLSRFDDGSQTPNQEMNVSQHDRSPTRMKSHEALNGVSNPHAHRHPHQLSQSTSAHAPPAPTATFYDSPHHLVSHQQQQYQNEQYAASQAIYQQPNPQAYPQPGQVSGPSYNGQQTNPDQYVPDPHYPVQAGSTRYFKNGRSIPYRADPSQNPSQYPPPVQFERMPSDGHSGYVDPAPTNQYQPEIPINGYAPNAYVPEAPQSSPYFYSQQSMMNPAQPMNPDQFIVSGGASRGYFANGINMNGSQLRQSDKTANEIAIELRDENERLIEQNSVVLKSSEDLKDKIESQQTLLKETKDSLVKSNRRNVSLRESMARLKVQIQDLETEKRLVEKNAEKAMRDIESRLDAVLMSTLSKARERHPGVDPN